MDLETKAYLIDRGLYFLDKQDRLPSKIVLVNLETDTHGIWTNLDRNYRSRIETTIHPPCQQDVDSIESQQNLFGLFINRVQEFQSNFVLTTDFSSLPTRGSRDLFRQNAAHYLPHNTNMIVIGDSAIQTGRNLWQSKLPVRAIYVPEVPTYNQVTIIPRESIYAAEPNKRVKADLLFSKSI